MMTKDFSREYGTALYGLSVEENTSERVFNEIREVCGIYLRSPDFVRLLSNPRLSASERAETVDHVFGGKIDGNLLNFLKILAEKRRSDILPKCFEVYKKLYCDDNGLLPVTAFSAVDLSENQKNRLEEKLRAKTGREILLTCKTDPSCIGGLRLEYDGKRYDASVRGRLGGLLKEINE